MGYVSVVRVAAYQSNTFDKKMYIPGVHPDKDSWTYTALFEINKKTLEMIIASMSARVTTNQSPIHSP